jgi:hypothetical protein
LLLRVSWRACKKNHKNNKCKYSYQKGAIVCINHRFPLLSY